MAERFTWLSQKHPAYINSIDEWTRNIKRFRGGKAVWDELVPFDWESKNGDHYRDRQRQATYLNFMERYASMIVGHMMAESPMPNFGTLGEVRRVRDVNAPTPAEQLYFNVDGIGSDGTQWVPWWTYVGKKAVNVGLEWLYMESPREAPRSQQDELNGKRPFFRNFGAPAVTNWHYEDGALAFATIQRRLRRPGVNAEGNIIGNVGDKQYLFFCRAGYDAFDQAGLPFSAGGWFLFNEDYEFQDYGIWTPTEGEIPMVPLYYDRLKADDGDFSIARSGTTEMGNAAIAYMNLSSAADYDGWDAAQSIQFLAGVDGDGYQLLVDTLKKGTKFAPLVANADNGKNPEVIDASMGAVAAQVFELLLRRKLEEVKDLMLSEVKRGPDTSGNSLDVSFADARAPRLALFAGEYETAQNAMIRWSEMGWGNKTPTGEVKWKRKFRLIDPMSAAREFYETANLSKVRSQTLDTVVMTQAAESRGFILNDEQGTKIRAELEASAKKQIDLLNAPIPIAGQPGRPGEGGGKGIPGTPGRPSANKRARNGGRGTASQRRAPAQE